MLNRTIHVNNQKLNKETKVGNCLKKQNKNVSNPIETRRWKGQFLSLNLVSR